MRTHLTKRYFISIFTISATLCLVGCQTYPDRQIDIESDHGESIFFSGDKPNDSNPNSGSQSNQEPTIISCPGAPPQRVKVGDRAYVSTKSDRLIVRKDGRKSSTEITRIEPGTQFTIIDGPKCDEANKWTYWKIETDNGLTGWVSEGGDSIDRYFIAPID